MITTLSVSVDAASEANVTTFSNAILNARQTLTASASQSKGLELTILESSLRTTAVLGAAAQTCALSQLSVKATSSWVTTATQTLSASLTCVNLSLRNALVRTGRKWSLHSEKI